MAAQQGIITFETPEGARFSYSMYLDDVATNPVRFLKDGKAGVSSPDNMIIDRLCAIVDVVIAAAPAQTTLVIRKNDMPVTTLLDALQLAAITTRPSPDLVYYPGQKLTITQVA